MMFASLAVAASSLALSANALLVAPSLEAIDGPITAAGAMGVDPLNQVVKLECKGCPFAKEVDGKKTWVEGVDNSLVCISIYPSVSMYTNPSIFNRKTPSTNIVNVADDKIPRRTFLPGTTPNQRRPDLPRQTPSPRTGLRLADRIERVGSRFHQQSILGEEVVLFVGETQLRGDRAGHQIEDLQHGTHHRDVQNHLTRWKTHRRQDRGRQSHGHQDSRREALDRQGREGRIERRWWPSPWTL